MNSQSIASALSTSLSSSPTLPAPRASSAGATPVAAPLHEPSPDALYRAALTFCINSADALLYATLKGASNAEQLWKTLDEAGADQPTGAAKPAWQRLESMFAQGLVRWGRKPTARALQSFRTAAAGWQERMNSLPSRDIIGLSDWFTEEGRYWIISPGHPCWPGQLEDLSIRSDWAPPLCLWGRGDPRALVSCAKPLAIVGSRDVTEYGRYVAHTLAEQAASLGHLIVSGGAMGTDAAAHWGALSAFDGRDANHVGRTVAVFAGGLNHIGPACNRPLFERIVSQGGALVSELVPSTVPEARRFLLRNRIIAALCSTLVVAQARLRSGALNTAGWACELMREVYAAPGNINQPANAGCNRIISDHRAMILCSASSAETICHETHTVITSAASAGLSVTAKDTAAKSHGSSGKANTDRGQRTSTPSDRQEPLFRPGIITVPSAPESTPQRARRMPDLRQTQPNTLPAHRFTESQRMIIALIKAAKHRRLPATTDNLLALSHELAPHEIPDIGTLLGLLGELELQGAVTRKAGSVLLSADADRAADQPCSAGVRESKP